ncbi:globin family protein [Gloeocapsa sp. BRSZ]
MALQVEVLEQSFERVKPYANEFAASFYNNLLTDYPQLQPLFAKTDMDQQHQKLIMSLILVVSNLRNPELLKITLQNLGARHVSYGTLQQHYPMVGAALLKTFESYLSKDWTPEVKQAWADAYGVLAEMMLEGAQSAEKSSMAPSPQLNPATVSTPGLVSANFPPQQESPQSIQHGESDAAVMSTSVSRPSVNLKLILLIAIVAGLLSLGIFYYSRSQQDNGNIRSVTESAKII